MFPEQETLEYRVNQDLAVRAKDGVWGHPVCLLLVCLTTTFVPEHPAVIAVFVLLFGAQTLLRLALLRRLPSQGSLKKGVWRRQISTLLVVSGGLWGALASWSCYVYGYHHSNTILLLLYHAAVAVVGAPTFLHDLRLARLYLLLMLVPPMIVHGLFPDAERWGPLCAFSFYGLFLTARAVRLHDEYLRNQRENSDLRAVAGSDPLTGLPNRLRMRRELTLAMEAARAEKRRLAVLFIDLDGFKAINDRYSHRSGDLFLCEIANRLTICAGSPDRVARLGGDEFTLVVAPKANADLREIIDIAKDVLDAAKRPVLIEGQPCSVTASVGISFFPDDADTVEDLLRAADHAMYEAKRTGSDQICFAGIRKTGDTHRSADLQALMRSISK